MSIDDNSDFYQLFGVNPQASATAIRSAYRQALRNWHPDTASQRGVDAATAHAHSVELTQAYAVLSDPQARARYDRSRTPLTVNASKRAKAPTRAPSSLASLRNVTLKSLRAAGVTEPPPALINELVEAASASAKTLVKDDFYLAPVAVHNALLAVAEDFYVRDSRSRWIQVLIRAARKLSTDLPQESASDLSSPRRLLLKLADQAIGDTIPSSSPGRHRSPVTPASPTRAPMAFIPSPRPATGSNFSADPRFKLGAQRFGKFEPASFSKLDVNL